MSRDWKFVKLKDVCQVVTGSTPKTNIPEYWDGEYPWVTPAELKGEKYISDTERHITDDAVAHTNLTLMPVGTVLLSSRAPIGKVAITETEMYCNQGFKNLICSNKIDNQYLYLWLSSQTEYLNSLGRGATFKEISKTIVENIEVPLTSIEKQHKIVAELNKIKSLLDLKHKQLDIYDKLAQSLFYETFGDPVENEKGWEVKKLGEIASPTIGLTYKPENVVEDGTIVLRSGNIQDSEIDLEDIVRVDTRIPENKYVKAGDILMCSRNGSFRLVGKVAMIKDIHEKMSYGAFMTIIRSEYNPYLFGYFKTPAFREYLIQGKTTTVNQITVKMLQDILLPIPPIELQKTFAERISAIEKQKENVRFAINKLQTLLNSRMDYWFVIQPVAEQIVENAMTEDNIKVMYDEYKQGKDIQDGTIHYDNGHPRGCTDNNMDFRLLADIYNYMKDSGETSIESVKERYSYTSHAKDCVLELKELGLLSSDDLKTFHIV